MQSWGAQREVEKVKTNPHNKCIVVDSGTCRNAIRVLHQDGGVNVWLGLDRDSLPEFIIGQGETTDRALADAVATLEALTKGIQERRYPDDWKIDTLGDD